MKTTIPSRSALIEAQNKTLLSLAAIPSLQHRDRRWRGADVTRRRLAFSFQPTPALATMVNIAIVARRRTDQIRRITTAGAGKPSNCAASR